MLSGTELLSSLYQKGVKIWENDGRLHYQAPAGILLPEDLADLRRVKDEILGILRSASTNFHSPIQRRKPGCQVPLTNCQHSIWRLKQTQDEPGAPNCVT